MAILYRAAGLAKSTLYLQLLWQKSAMRCAADCTVPTVRFICERMRRTLQWYHPAKENQEPRGLKKPRDGVPTPNGHSVMFWTDYVMGSNGQCRFYRLPCTTTNKRLKPRPLEGGDI